jgi:hypothetical protein
MTIYYAIMERTPFPGYWRNCPLYRLQEAERTCFPSDIAHYQRAIKSPNVRDFVLFYRLQDAELIIAYLQATCDFADYQALGMVA